MTTRVIIVSIEIASHELLFPELDIKQTETTIMTWNAATYWDIRDRRLAFTDRPILMGILNVTPDSFSDGGKFYSVQSAVDQAKRMEDHGAGILDVGGESTRPYSESVAQDEELRRVTEVLERLQGKVAIPISIDTKKAAVANAAIQLGASIINDVSGLEADPAMVDVAKQTGVGVCAMHMQGTPQTMQDNPRYDDVVEDILLYLKQRRRWLMDHGIEESKICLDPGIGFGKTHEHNITLLQNAYRFTKHRNPFLSATHEKGLSLSFWGAKT
jgi:dihydropteroate synthase